MTPKMTARGRALLVACAITLVVCAAIGAPTTGAVAPAVILVVCTSYVLTMPESRRLRADTIELAWWVVSDAEHRRERVVAHRPFGLRFYVRQLGATTVRVTRFELVSDSVSPVTDERLAFHIPPRSRVDLELRCACDAPGRAVLHGARISVEGPLGLFETRLYFPNRLRLVSLPSRGVARLSSRMRDDARSSARRAVRHARDEGTDLHELRELRPGDPYRRIAWKTSARLGRLVVRELEREELGSLDIVLDASASMREGVPGHRRIDRAVALALGVAEDALARGERVGFVAVDRRVLVRVPRAAAADQRERIADALVTALSCVDADRTVEDDADVARSVARYVRFQEGADFLDPSVRDGVHVERLALHVASRAKGHHEVTGPTSASRILRRYADLMAIPLTPRSDRDPDARNAALSAALAPLAGRRSAPAKLVVITDGVDVDFDVRLRPTLTRLRTHGHVVEVLLVPKRLPGAHDLGLDEDSPIVTAYVEDDLARLKALTLRLRARGVTSSVDWRGGRTRSVA